MNELARILGALSAAFLLRSVLFLVAAIIVGQALGNAALAVRDAKVNETRLADLEMKNMALTRRVGALQHGRPPAAARDASG